MGCESSLKASEMSECDGSELVSRSDCSVNVECVDDAVVHRLP